MTYVMSDIHGQYEKYGKMLETIDFSGTSEQWKKGGGDAAMHYVPRDVIVFCSDCELEYK